MALPVTDNAPLVVKLPPRTFPVAVINPLVPMLPMLAFPETETLVSTPTLVTLG